jgi:hypothetical protein
MFDRFQQLLLGGILSTKVYPETVITKRFHELAIFLRLKVAFLSSAIGISAGLPPILTAYSTVFFCPGDF